MSSEDKRNRTVDIELMALCSSGDGRAWKTLVERYGDLVYSVCRSTGLSEADAADITQQTFCILQDSLPRLQAEVRLGGWLATVARRHSWRLLVRRRRESVVDPMDMSERIESTHAEKQRSTSMENLEWVHHGLSLMDKRCRTLLTELYLKESGPSYEEVSRRLNLPLGSIGPQRARCLQKLRSLLESP